MQSENIEPSVRKGKRLPEEEAATNSGKTKKRSSKKAKVGILALVFEDSTLEVSFEHPET